MTTMFDYSLVISPKLTVPFTELTFRTSRSSGPGGQNVNKVETRVELLFDVAHSPALDGEQRERLLAGLTSWLDSDGVLHLVSDRYRSQYRNREDVVERFVTLLQHALRPQKSRKPTRVPHAVREERMQQKKRRGETKRQRGRSGYEE